MCIRDRSNCSCIDVNYAGSLIYCGFEHTTKSKKDRLTFMEEIIETCPKMTEQDIYKIYDNVTNYFVNVSDISSFNASLPISFPIKYEENKFYPTFYMNKYWYVNGHYSFYFGVALTAYFPTIYFFSGLLSWIGKLFPSHSMSFKRAIQNFRISKLAREYVLTPALYKGIHTRPFGLTGGFVPTRLHSIFIAGFYFCSLVFNFYVLGKFVPHNSVFDTEFLFKSRMIGERSGIISTFLMIPTFLFAGRNNFFLWWTGWKQSTFFQYHKAVARVCIGSALVHTFGYLAYFLRGHYYKNAHSLKYWIWGSVSMVAGCIIFIQAMGRLRSWNYELFLYCHLLMAVFFLVGAWIHVDEFGWAALMYFCTAFWAFDRFARLVRMAYFGIRTAKVSLLDDNVLEIIVPRHGYWPVYPGAYGYIYFMRTSLFWQSHPFSVISSDDGKTVEFYVKMKRGATETIQKYLQTQRNNRSDLNIALEGPYGHYVDMNEYQNVVLYSSGNGITGVYPFISDCLENPNSKVKSVKLYWIVQTLESVGWFLSELKKLQSYQKVETIIYLTRYQDKKQSSDSSSEEINQKLSDEEKCHYKNDIDNLKANLPHAEIIVGRPNLTDVVRDDINALVNLDVGVISCGHPAICDQIRASIAEISGSRSGGVLDYIEELQVW